jgi:hypothetical protein
VCISNKLEGAILVISTAEEVKKMKKQQDNLISSELKLTLSNFSTRRIGHFR